MPIELLSVHPRDIYLVFSIPLRELESISRAGMLLMARPSLKEGEEEDLQVLDAFLKEIKETIKELRDNNISPDLRTDNAPPPIKRV